MKYVISPIPCITISLHAKVVTKAVDPTSTPSHYSRSSGYDHRVMPFLDVEAKKCIEHVSDKEEGMNNDSVNFRASMHDSTLTTLNALITLWALICVTNFLLYFHLCPKILASRFSTMPPSIHFSNLHGFYKYSLEHA